MKKAMITIMLIIGVFFVPSGLFAQQEAHHPETPAVAPDETELDIFEEEEETGQQTAGGGMMAHHRHMKSKVREMNAQLQQKIDSMNEATGEQKIQAMADVINTMFSQRREMMGKMMGMHGKMCKMMGKKDKGKMSMMDDGRMMKMKKRMGDEEKSMIIIIQE